jgi:hypothetical protein
VWALARRRTRHCKLQALFRWFQWFCDSRVNPIRTTLQKAQRAMQYFEVLSINLFCLGWGQIGAIANRAPT